MTEPTAPRGTPPNQKQLTKSLGPKLAVWDGVVEMGTEFEAKWRWMHSEATGSWSYRAYLPGDRFLMALSPLDDKLELSLNLKAEEWDFIHTPDPAESAFLDALREEALASGKDPAWLHIPLESTAVLPAIAKLLIARGRRVQPPRRKKGR
ncbi:MAG TPA: DUF3788 family protein [Oscillatoriaceae cyanobacterium]